MRNIYAIFGQRKERYEGEFASEFLDGIDNFSHDENPDWLQDKLDKYRKSYEFENVQVVKLSFNGNLIENILRTHMTDIESEIEEL